MAVWLAQHGFLCGAILAWPVCLVTAQEVMAIEDSSVMVQEGSSRFLHDGNHKRGDTTVVATMEALMEKDLKIKKLEAEIRWLNEHDRQLEAEGKHILQAVDEADEDQEFRSEAADARNEESAGDSEEAGEGEEHKETDEESPEGGEFDKVREEVLEGQELTLAIALMGFVVFIMTLFYLVNWNDEDMKIYVWTVISTTISIFIAVFTFTSVRDVLHAYILNGEETFDLRHLSVAFGQTAVYFAAMQFMVAYVSGSLEKEPFNAEDSIHAQYESREIGFKSLATFMSHLCAFASINFGGCLQHHHPFNTSVEARFAVPPVMLILFLVICRCVRVLRLYLIKKIKSQHSYGEVQAQIARRQSSCAGGAPGIEWCLAKWDEETYTSENEIAGMCVSFLLVNACRYGITGVMPDTMGIEEDHYRHPFEASYKLSGLGVVFAICCMMLVIWDHGYMPPRSHLDPGSFMAWLKRLISVIKQIFAVAFAWCLLFSAKWAITQLVQAYPPNGVVSRVILALAVSAVTFVAILALDALADHDATGEQVDEAIKAVIHALALLVGFSWEQSFDGAVEVLAERCFAGTLTAQLGLSAAVCIIVYPAWRKYILHKLLKLIWTRDNKRHSVIEYE